MSACAIACSSIFIRTARALVARAPEVLAGEAGPSRIEARRAPCTGRFGRRSRNAASCASNDCTTTAPTRCFACNGGSLPAAFLGLAAREIVTNPEPKHDPDKEHAKEAGVEVIVHRAFFFAAARFSRTSARMHAGALQIVFDSSVHEQVIGRSPSNKGRAKMQ